MIEPPPPPPQKASSLQTMPLVCPLCGGAVSGRVGLRCASDGMAMCLPSLMPSKGDPLLGRVIGGRYPLVGLLGKGGMGAVYRAVQEPLGRAVALKLIRTSQAGSGDESMLRRRFMREAQAVAALAHPSIVSLYDYGEEEGGLVYMVMEMVEGPSLKEVLKKEGRLTTIRMVKILDQILAGLHHAHQAGVVHRDLKPANVMLQAAGTPAERVKLLDFGVAKVFSGFDEGLADLTQGASGTTIGTPRYMAPEQVVNAPVSAQTDLYAAGIVAWNLLAGRPPFDGPSGYHIHRLQQEAPVPPLPPELEVPAEVERVILWALEKLPARRPGDALEMAAALRAAVSAPSAVFEVGVDSGGPNPRLQPAGQLTSPNDETSGHGEASQATVSAPGLRAWHLVAGVGLCAAVGAAVVLASRGAADLVGGPQGQEVGRPQMDPSSRPISRPVSSAALPTSVVAATVIPSVGPSPSVSAATPSAPPPKPSTRPSPPARPPVSSAMPAPRTSPPPAPPPAKKGVEPAVKVQRL